MSEKINEVKTPRETKFCSNCGSQIDAKAEICPKCGARVALPETREAPQGGVRVLLYLVSFFIPIVGIILGIIYLTKSSKDEHNFGVICLILGIIGPMVEIFITLLVTFLFALSSV